MGWIDELKNQLRKLLKLHYWDTIPAELQASDAQQDEGRERKESVQTDGLSETSHTPKRRTQRPTGVHSREGFE